MARFRGRQSTSGRERSRGQTETIGVVLLLGMTIIGAMSVVAFGATAFQDAQDSSTYEGISHAMTQFDSRAAIVALGDTDTQTVPFGSGGSGTYTVEPEAGWMNVSHVNGTDVEPFLNTSLGALVYSDRDVEIAYQGGGVWRKQGDGSVMVSPPEFHYRDATLTLPVILVNGSSSAAGSTRASITNEMSARQVFPNASASDYWSTDEEYRNPVSTGNITVTVHSEYYRAWAEYFRTRSDGEVDVYHSNRTVRLTLVTSSILGDFDFPEEGVGGALTVTGMSEEHPINNFTVRLETETFNNRHWSLHSEKGGQELELHVYSPSGADCDGGTYSGTLDVGVYYYNGTTDYYQGWQNQSINPNEDENFDCTENSLTINFTGDTSLDYTEIDVPTGQAGWYYASQIDDNSIAPTAEFDQHDVDDDDPRNGIYNYTDPPSENDSMNFVVNHYLTLLGPSFDLTVDEGPGGSSKVNYDESSGTLDYEQSEGSLITFLHVTENRIRVELR